MNARDAKEWFDLLRQPWLLRLFVDYRYWVFVPLSFVLLFFSIRFYLGDRNLSQVIRSSQFLVPFAFLVASWTATYYVLYRPTTPKDNGLVYVTVADFGSDEKATRLQEQISAEIEKHLQLFDNVSFQPYAVRETVDNTDAAEKLARARGLHLIVFGKTELLDEKSTECVRHSFRSILISKFALADSGLTSRQTCLASTNFALWQRT
jgi:hypothetical protein